VARIAIFNQKGGVGKTTTSLNLAAALTRGGQTPLTIDLDPQAHLSAITGVGVDSPDDSIYSFYQSGRLLSPLVREGRGGWPVIPAHLDLSKVDSLGKGPQVLNRLNAGIVKENLNTGRPILIDCCPMLGVLSLSAIFACDRVLVPVSADWLALKGVLQVEKTLKALEHVFRRRVPRRIVVTRFDSRRRMSHDIYRQIKERYGAELCETMISESVSVAESPASHEDVFTHAPASRGARDYEALLDELVRTEFFD
jgi:chromosome partitioning protein